MATTLDKPAAGPKRKKARRGRGEGCIYFRSSDRLWVGTVSLGVGVDANGKPKRNRRTVYGETKGAVQTELAKLQTENASGLLIKADRATVAEFLTLWLADVAKPSLRASTYSNYSRVVKKHIMPRIGGGLLQKLTPAHVQSLYGQMARDGAGVNPQRLAHVVLKLALKHALKQGLVSRNVCDGATAPAATKAHIEPLDHLQAAALLAAAKGDRLEALYHLALGSGMREGEIFGLHWADVDFTNGRVSVRQSLAEVNGRLVLGAPKSNAGRRMIDLPDHVMVALEAHRKAMMAEGKGGLAHVFCTPSGGYLRRSHFHTLYKPLLKAAGLPDIRFHDLRHTHATLLLLAGVNAKVVQERLGHASIAITVNTYTHVLPSMKTDTAAKLEAIFQAATAANENGHRLATKTA